MSALSQKPLGGSSSSAGTGADTTDKQKLPLLGNHKHVNVGHHCCGKASSRGRPYRI